MATPPPGLLQPRG